jgi:hypothetical protein
MFLFPYCAGVYHFCVRVAAMHLVPWILFWSVVSMMCVCVCVCVCVLSVFPRPPPTYTELGGHGGIVGIQ